jgi:pyruvate dehydrogenase (quinone)
VTSRLYTESISSPAQAPSVIHQAIAAAYAGRGVAHLTLPMDVLMAKASGAIASVATLKPRPEIVASEEDIAEIARRIDEAGSIVIMCGAGCHGAADELRELSDRLKVPLIHSVKGKDIMPYDDARWMGGIGMIGTKARLSRRHALRFISDARHRLSVFRILAAQGRRYPDR